MKKQLLKVTAASAVLALCAVHGASAQTSWSLNGNAGTDTSFLGTTNNADLRLKTNNTTRMSLTKSGNIQLFGNTEITGQLIMDSGYVKGPFIISSDTGSFYFDPNIISPAPNHDRMRVSTGVFSVMHGFNLGTFKITTPNVNTGLGTETPNSKLHLFTSGSTGVYELFTNGTNSNSLNGFQLGIATTGNAELNQRQNLPMLFYTNNTEQMRILANGSVLIGTQTGVFGKLEVENSNQNVSGYFKLSNPTGIAAVSGFYTGSSSTTANIAGVQGTAVSVNGSGGVFFGGKTGVSASAFPPSSSSTAVGVQADASMAFQNYGVYGIAIGSTNALVNYGVRGYGSNASNQNAGFYGIATGSAAQTNYGVVASAQDAQVTNYGGAFAAPQSSSGYNCGVTGQAANGAVNHGVYGDAGAPSSTNFAGYFNGDIKVNSTVYTSDSTLKKNVAGIKDALKIISQLKPCTFDFKTTQYPYLNLPGGMHYGFLSQEVEPVIPDIVEEVVHPFQKDSLGDTISPLLRYKGLEYIELIPILMQGIKELDARTYCVVCDHEQMPGDSSGARLSNPGSGHSQDNLDKKLRELDSLNRALEDRIKVLEGMASANEQGSVGQAITKKDVELLPAAIVLEQNVPNPFAENTTISYFIPDNTGAAQIIFYEASGRIIKVVDIKEKGAGQLTVYAGNMSSGIYTYSIVVDGKTIDTKKMIKSK